MENYLLLHHAQCFFPQGRQLYLLNELAPFVLPWVSSRQQMRWMVKRAKTKKKVESGHGESGKPLSKGEKLSQREVKKKRRARSRLLKVKAGVQNEHKTWHQSWWKWVSPHHYPAWSECSRYWLYWKYSWEPILAADSDLLVQRRKIVENHFAPLCLW